MVLSISVSVIEQIIDISSRINCVISYEKGKKLLEKCICKQKWKSIGWSKGDSTSRQWQEQTFIIAKWKRSKLEKIGFFCISFGSVVVDGFLVALCIIDGASEHQAMHNGNKNN